MADNITASFIELPPQLFDKIIAAVREHLCADLFQLAEMERSEKAQELGINLPAIAYCLSRRKSNTSTWTRPHILSALGRPISA